MWAIDDDRAGEDRTEALSHCPTHVASTVFCVLNNRGPKKDLAIFSAD